MTKEGALFSSLEISLGPHHNSLEIVDETLKLLHGVIPFDYGRAEAVASENLDSVKIQNKTRSLERFNGAPNLHSWLEEGMVQLVFDQKLGRFVSYPHELADITGRTSVEEFLAEFPPTHHVIDLDHPDGAQEFMTNGFLRDWNRHKLTLLDLELQGQIPGSVVDNKQGSHIYNLLYSQPNGRRLSFNYACSLPAGIVNDISRRWQMLAVSLKN